MPYKVISNLSHDGLLHTAGAVLDLPADVAENLVERGLVESTTDAPTVESTPVTEDKKEVETATENLSQEATAGQSDTPHQQPSVNNTQAQPVSSSTDLHLN